MGALDTAFWRAGPSPGLAPTLGVTLDPVSSLLASVSPSVTGGNAGSRSAEGPWSSGISFQLPQWSSVVCLFAGSLESEGQRLLVPFHPNPSALERTQRAERAGAPSRRAGPGVKPAAVAGSLLTSTGNGVTVIRESPWSAFCEQDPHSAHTPV